MAAKAFPTGKGHISFSEVKAWAECPFRHYLMYVEKINTYNDNPYADFGTTIHNAIEEFLNGKAFDLDDINKKLDEIWDKGGYDTPEYIKGVEEDRASNGWKYTHESLDDYKSSAKNIIGDFELFMNETFPGWEPISAEVELYDWKTTGKTGWFYKKKKEFLSLAQVGLYKNYWASKFGIPVKDIKAGYVFLKRGAKPGKTCELLEVAATPKFLEKTNTLVKKMITNVQNGVKLKNYNNCTFCPYKGTEHCNGKGW